MRVKINSTAVKKSKLPVLLIATLLPAVAWFVIPNATRADGHHTHYVATTGDDQGGANNCTVEANPCATIAHAITIAPADSVIHVAAGTYNEHSLAIGKNLTIDGDGAGTTIVDGNAGGRVFNITAGVVTIEDLTATDGHAVGVGTDAHGGGIHNTGTLTLTDVSVTGNLADDHGGGIRSTGVLTMTGGEIASNTAGDLGGGIVAGSNIITLTDVVVSGNTGGALGGGGIVAFGTGTFTVMGGEITNNTTTANGGGIWNNGTLTVGGMNPGEAVTITGNTADGQGDGVFRSAGTVTAEGNWWGDLRGPQHVDNPNTGTGQEIVGVVDFSPWCADDACSNYYELPAALTFNVQPTNTVANSTITPAPAIRLVGTEGYRAINATNTIDMTLSGGNTTMLGGTTSIAAVDGDATFNDLSIGVIGTGYQLNAVDSGALFSSAPSNLFNIITPFPAGNGAEGDPYQITDCELLQATNLQLDAHYVLNNDIDCSDTINWNSGDGFVPIGEFAGRFGGTFDGRGFTISDMYIDGDVANGFGLFGVTEVGSSISNVGLENARIMGGADIGGLVGENHSSITNAFVAGSVEASGSNIGGLVGVNFGTITRSYSTANVIGDDRVGGLVGRSAAGSTITSSFASGDVTENNQFQDGISLGGLVGENGGGISNSYATGNVNAGEPERIGGLVGDNITSGVISNSYAIGEITDNGGSGSTAGGLAGDNSGSITGSFWNTETSGQATSAGGEGKTTAEMKDILTFSAATWDIVVTNDHNLNNGYPFLTWQAGDSSPVWYIFEPSIPDGNGIPDCTENFVDCFVNPVTGTNVILEADEACTISAAEMKPEADMNISDPSFEYPIGLMNFTLDCGTPGYTTTIKQYYFNVTDDGYVLRKHNPTTDTYFTIEGATIEQTVLGGQIVTIATYQATDGGELDIDGEVNGTIVDPVGLALSPDDLADTGQNMWLWVGGALTAIATATGLFIYARREQTQAAEL